MELQTFLANPANSRSREYLLTTRLVHDLTVAAAVRGYDLLVYLPTVDSDGFDLILDDRDRLLPVQLKSVIEGGKAGGWHVHRKLVRPEPQAAELYGFELSPTGVGRSGGVILTTVTAASDGQVTVKYAYTDIDVLSAMWFGIIPTTRMQHKRLERLRRELESNVSGKIELPRCAFLSVPSPEHLLAICGLHSRAEQPWRLQLTKLLGNLHLKRELQIPEETLRRNIRDYIKALSYGTL